MKITVVLTILWAVCTAGVLKAQVAMPDHYLDSIKVELNKVWPKNRRINLVFHGHSVPGGSWNDHKVNTLESYPNLVLEKLKAKYPYAVINTIITAVGGENSVKGAARFKAEVLNHRPDVLFIDYSLNDRGVGLEKAAAAWRQMIEEATALGIKVILLTPSPDQRVDLSKPDNELEQHAVQVRELARRYGVGMVDSYARFVQILTETGSVKDFMSSVNHPNKPGHQVIADAICDYF